MTPEGARELLDGRTPSPWWWCENDYPEVTVYHEKYGTIAKSVDIEEADLVCAAPALAEIVAGLRYEYAAQVRRGTASPWLYVLQNGHFSKRGSTSVWCKKRKGCDNAIRSALKRKDVGADTVEFRIVRRLVSEPEVVE